MIILIVEEWKEIEGYPNYLVSVQGEVMNLNYRRTGQKKKMKLYAEKDGYKRVRLSNGKKNKLFLVHRLVAQTFIPNPSNYPEVNHIDENKTNNCVWNLEWCDRAYNMNYGTRTSRANETCKRKRKERNREKTKCIKHEKRGRKVVCLNNGMIFDTVKEAAKWGGIKVAGNIGKQIKGEKRSAGKHPITGEKLKWKYID